MRARIPYLARLARRDAGPTALRPPRQLFAGEAFTHVRPARHDDSPRWPAENISAPVAARAPQPADAAEGPPASRWIMSPLGADASGDRVGGALPGVTGSAAGAASAIGAVTPAGPVAESAKVPPRPAPPAGADRAAVPAGPDLAAQAAPQPPLAAPDPRDPLLAASYPPFAPPARPPRMADVGSVAVPAAPDPADQAAVSPRPSRSRTGSPTVAATSAATPPAGPAAHAAGPVRPGTPEAPADTALARPPVSPASIPQRETPVELAQPANPPAGLRASAPGNEMGIPSARGTLDAADGPGRSGGTAAVHDLLPSPGLAPGPIEPSGLRPGGSRQLGGAARPRVSIGTIEVTVVPPARPEPAADVQPPARAARGRSGEGFRPAASMGSDRLRSGLRRWYGTAQG